VEDVQQLLPLMEKALLRAPEHALRPVSDFVLAYTNGGTKMLDDPSWRRLFAVTLTGAKSSNAIVRSGVISLFSALAPSVLLIDGEKLGTYALGEIIAPVKAPKSTGPEHRLTLYTMLAALPPSPALSPSLVTAGLPLLAKEAHEGCIVAFAEALGRHLEWMLVAGQDVDGTAWAREMASTKSALRRAVVALVGGAVWSAGTQAAMTKTTGDRNESLMNAATRTFLKTVVPAFEASLKSAATPVGTSTQAAGPFEGFVAVAVLLGPVSGFGEHGGF
jgi:hypothetical protein